MLWILITLAVLFWAVLRYWRLRKLTALGNKLGSSLKSYPFIGISYMFLGNQEDHMRSFEAIGRDSLKHGGISKFQHLGQLFVCITDPEATETVLNNCLEKHDIMKVTRAFIGNGSIFAPVPIWRPRRKNMAPTFSMKNLVHFIEVFTNKSTVMANLMEQEAGKGSFSMLKYAYPYTMDSVCETTLGISMNKQNSSDDSIYKAFEILCEIGARRLFSPWFHNDYTLKLMPGYSKAWKAREFISEFVNKIIERKTQVSAENDETNDKDYRNTKSSYIDMQLSQDKSQCRTPVQELIEECLILLIGGSDSTAICISFTLLLLSQHPDIQEKIYKEIREVIGDVDMPISHKDLNQLTYLDAVIRESLRLFPPAPIIVRKVEKDVTLPSGITLVEGCGVLINIWAAHRNPKYWGEDAEKFRPERFLEGPLKYPAAFLAFSYGQRGCLGFQYAMMSLKTSLATILRKYRVLPSAGNVHIRTKFDMMLRDSQNYEIRVELRD